VDLDETLRAVTKSMDVTLESCSLWLAAKIETWREVLVLIESVVVDAKTAHGVLANGETLLLCQTVIGIDLDHSDDGDESGTFF
jgi:predicted RNA methylase